MGRNFFKMVLVFSLVLNPNIGIAGEVNYFGNGPHEKWMNETTKQVEEDLPIVTDEDLMGSLKLSVARAAGFCAANLFIYATFPGLILLLGMTTFYVATKSIDQIVGEIPEGENELYQVENHENGFQMIMSAAFAPANQCVHEIQVLGKYVAEAWNRGLIPGSGNSEDEDEDEDIEPFDTVPSQMSGLP